MMNLLRISLVCGALLCAVSCGKKQSVESEEPYHPETSVQKKDPARAARLKT